MVFHVPNLVDLAALDHRVIDHVDHRLAQWSVQARPRAPPAAMSSGRVASLFW